MNTLSPFRLQKLLRGLTYPAQRERILACAARAGADRAVIEALAALPPEEQFESPVALSRRVSYSRN